LADSEAQIPYKFHFGPEPTLLSEPIREDVDQGKWKKSVLRHGKLGAVSLSLPESSGTVTPVTQVSVSLSVPMQKWSVSHILKIREKLRSAYDARGAQLSTGMRSPKVVRMIYLLSIQIKTNCARIYSPHYLTIETFLSPG
jgi:hypothetical protein